MQNAGRGIQRGGGQTCAKHSGGVDGRQNGDGTFLNGQDRGRKMRMAQETMHQGVRGYGNFLHERKSRGAMGSGGSDGGFRNDNLDHDGAKGGER
eukprot:3800751-Pleurochrysis_carterae.AAC.1